MLRYAMMQVGHMIKKWSRRLDLCLILLLHIMCFLKDKPIFIIHPVKQSKWFYG